MKFSPLNGLHASRSTACLMLPVRFAAPADHYLLLSIGDGQERGLRLDGGLLDFEGRSWSKVSVTDYLVNYARVTPG